MGCTRANTDGNGEYREADKNGSVLARNPHFGHGACVTYRETPHPSSVSPMAICIPIEHFGHGACALYSRRHPRVQSMGQPADTMSARAYHPPSDNDRVSRALSAPHHGLRPRSNGRAGTWGKPELVAFPYWARTRRHLRPSPKSPKSRVRGSTRRPSSVVRALTRVQRYVRRSALELLLRLILRLSSPQELLMLLQLLLLLRATHDERAPLVVVEALQHQL